MEGKARGEIGWKRWVGGEQRRGEGEGEGGGKGGGRERGKIRKMVRWASKRDERDEGAYGHVFK